MSGLREEPTAVTDPPRRGHAGRQDRRQGGVVHRGDPGVPGSDRRDRRASTTRFCTSRRNRRWPRLPGSTPPWPQVSRCRRRWPASRWRSRTCSPPPTCRPLADRRSSRAGRRRTTPPSPRGCARRASRSWARRTWTSSRWASSTENSAYGPTRNPVERRPGAGRIGRRQRGGAGRVPGAAGHRIGHRRVDPPARRADRDRRREAHLRHGVAVRADRVRVVAGPGRPVRPHGARHRAAAPGHRRARRERLHVGRRRGARRGRAPPGPAPPAT